MKRRRATLLFACAVLALGMGGAGRSAHAGERPAAAGARKSDTANLAPTPSPPSMPTVGAPRAVAPRPPIAPAVAAPVTPTERWFGWLEILLGVAIVLLAGAKIARRRKGASPAAKSADERSLALLLLLFVASGCAALIYEIVWFQMLQLVLGSSAVSIAVLLGTFMGGMCLGSLGLSRFVSRHRHPLRVYAMLEIAIGVSGILMLGAMPLVQFVYTAVVGHGIPGLLLRGLFAAICLLPPTVMMGATLPAVSRWVEMSPRGVSWLGTFYGGNTLGAVFGCLLAGFYLLRVHDMHTATFVAVALNAAVAAGAFALARARPEAAQRDPSRDLAAVAISAPTTPAWIIYLAIGLSGMSALGAEVIWTRLFGLLLSHTTYTFSIILAVFLIGIGLGSGRGLVHRAPEPQSAPCARLRAARAGRGHRLGVVEYHQRAALLAGQSAPGVEPVESIPDRFRPLPVGDPACGLPVGRQLSPGARRSRVQGSRWRRGGGPHLRGEHGGRHRRGAGHQPGADRRGRDAKQRADPDRDFGGCRRIDSHTGAAARSRGAALRRARCNLDLGHR